MWENEVKHFKIQLGTSRDDPEVAGYRDATSARAKIKDTAAARLQEVEEERRPELRRDLGDLLDTYAVSE